MSTDRYEYVAKVLKKLGWLQDFILGNLRHHIVEVLHAREVDSVLDACCRSGTLSVYLRDSDMNVTGVDASQSMLAIARSKASDIAFIEADLTNFDMKEKVGAAVIVLSLHEMEEEIRVKIWETMKKTTKPGGVLVVADFIASERKRLLSKISWKFMWGDEKNIGKHDPGHFENFEAFMEQGGLKNWLIKRGENILQERYFQWGNMGVLVVEA